MDIITKVNQLSFRTSLSDKQAFVIKLTGSKFDKFAGLELLGKIESWVSANLMMNQKDVPVLIIDMQNVEFIDSEGLNKLLGALKIMQAQNSNLLLCSQQPSVSLVFEITRVDQFFAIFPSFDTFIDQYAPQIVSKALVAA